MGGNSISETTGAALTDTIVTEIQFTVRDPKHKREKPYDLRYEAGGAIPKTNARSESHQTKILNFRPFQNAQNFDEFGFSVESLSSAWTESMFDEKEKIKDLYYHEVESILRRKFPDATGVYILEHGLRKRHVQFPALEKGISVEYSQPATLAHIDCSLNVAVRTAQSAFSIASDQCQRVLSINFWKSLQGPGNDWPLALCDQRTMNHSLDTIVADVVYPNRYTENESGFYNPQQEWYYIKDLADDEIVMFLQKDSGIESGGGVAHTSFYNSSVTEDAKPRTSIEMRTYVVFA
ncbi:hypothetical protein K458DRAFT_288137 [Lentithecium fluviatile CBS 122367]|uniref:Methyltransferase n=1 Tax=Lentithecium fluviatile CBS 122367 TaxID=1168545 RepID=A0A6G1JKR4_9PLEO|nr:hypothetical protein K458DRAFT_288137 [Lentithecium fluviatile CBS 122367]